MENSFWNERYNQYDFVYGESPNIFFADTIEKLNPGTIVLPCEGEGRNAVYAARKGWDVKAFDLSNVGKQKADLLALKYGAIIDFQIMDASLAHYPEKSVDVVALIYTHLPLGIRKTMHENLVKWLKPGGKVILEAFCPDQLNNSSGGPKDVSMLYTKEMLSDDFKDLQIELLEYKHIDLNEGEFHKGPADVIRMITEKK